MYEPHPKITIPDDSDIVWRYVDFAGFLSLLANSTLYFRRCDKFEDTWDARYSTFPLLLKATFPDDETRTRSLRSYLTQQQYMRSTMFANCWHRSQHEDAAMWEIYTARKSGIAIQSTIGRLKESIQNNSRKMYIGNVLYGDFDLPNLGDPSNGLVPCFVKREEYKFEREVRILVWSIQPGPLNPDEPIISPSDVGFSCPVDIERLVESVVIAPALDAHMITTLQHILDKCGLGHIPVRRSKLAESPPTLADFDSHEPRMFTLTMQMEEPMVKLLIKVCEEYHHVHHKDTTAPVHSVNLLNAVNRAASDAKFS